MLLIVTTAALSILYRFGPCRPEADWRWVTPGTLVATVAWLAMSELFTWYVANFGHYDRTYGSPGGCRRLPDVGMAIPDGSASGRRTQSGDREASFRRA
jgi:hypothetical protein